MEHHPVFYSSDYMTPELDEQFGYCPPVSKPGDINYQPTEDVPFSVADRQMMPNIHNNEERCAVDDNSDNRSFHCHIRQQGHKTQERSL